MTKRQRDFVVVTGVWDGRRGGPSDQQAVLVRARTYDHASDKAAQLGYAVEGATAWRETNARKVWFVWSGDLPIEQCMAPELVTECIKYQGVTTVRAFVEACYGLNNNGIYALFEYGIPDALRNGIYEFADDNTPEPARSAFWMLGFMYGVESLFNY